MFVAMGLSAVFPVLHGMELYGVEEMRGRIGLIWLVLQGFLYILGAGLYAVSLQSTDMSDQRLKIAGSMAGALFTRHL
jgi:predicted membrane channel-forming protein YqfA (hemolysin III family)